MANGGNKPFSVEIQKEFNVLDKSWSETIFLKLFVSMRTSGLLAALGPERTQSLINLATFMDGDGQCRPSLETLAEGLGISAQAAGDRYRELARFRWNGQPIVEKQLVRDSKTHTIQGTIYTILPSTGLVIFDGNKPGNPRPAPTCSPLHVASEAEGQGSPEVTNIRNSASLETRAPSLHVVEPPMAGLHDNKKEEGTNTERQQPTPKAAFPPGTVVVSDAEGQRVPQSSGPSGPTPQTVDRYRGAFASLGAHLRGTLIRRWLRQLGPARLDLVLAVMRRPREHGLHGGVQNPTRFAIYAVGCWSEPGPDKATTKAEVMSENTGRMGFRWPKSLIALGLPKTTSGRCFRSLGGAPADGG